MSNFQELLLNVRAFVFDVDGVLSESSMPMHPLEGPMRTANIKDGYAIQHAVKKGFHVAIITGGSMEAVRRRFQGLGVKDIYMRSSVKIDDLKLFMQLYSLEPIHVLYMGDDIPDFQAMQYVGIPVCPADAAQEIKSVSVYISPFAGGKGCVRDVMEQTMKVQGKWMDDYHAFGW